MAKLDPRLHAFRPDLADSRLKGQVEAPRFVEGRAAQCIAPFSNVLQAPRIDAPMLTQLNFGENVLIFDQHEGFAWVQSLKDNYVGYVAEFDLMQDHSTPDYKLSVPRSFLYQSADLKSPVVTALSLGAVVKVETFKEHNGAQYAVLPNRMAVFAKHLCPLEQKVDDYVTIAESLIGTPYRWGGTTAFGIDCSGLVQLAFAQMGQIVLRDTDMQQQTIGTPIDPELGLKRGDLVFWKGHVAIMTNDRDIIHANGYTMQVTCEPLEQAITRIGALYGQPLCYRRPNL